MGFSFNLYESFTINTTIESYWHVDCGSFIQEYSEHVLKFSNLWFHSKTYSEKKTGVKAFHSCIKCKKIGSFLGVSYKWGKVRGGNFNHFLIISTQKDLLEISPNYQFLGIPFHEPLNRIYRQIMRESNTLLQYGVSKYIYI